MNIRHYLKEYRKNINPPYSLHFKEYYSILGTIFILLAIPLTVISIFTLRQFQTPAEEATSGPNIMTSFREFFDEKGNSLYKEAKKIKVSDNPNAYIDGQTDSQRVKSNSYVIYDQRPEAKALKKYIVELTGKNLGQKNKELEKNKVKPADRAKRLKTQKAALALEHKKIKEDIGKAIGKKMTKGLPKKGERRVFFEYDTSVNAITIELLPKEVSKVNKIAGVKRIEVDKVVKANLNVSVPITKADQAWALIDGIGAPLSGYGIKIGVIDTGVDYTHSDLGGCFGTGCKVVGGFDFVNGDSNPMDDQGHGTHVAATIAGRGTLIGVAPDAEIYAYKVLGSSGSGSTSAVVAAIEYCVDPNRDGNLADHLDVCSMSLGGPGTPEDIDALASDNAMNNGVVMTIAAGNDGPGYETIGSPGVARKVITVGASCKPADIGRASACASQIASFSSRGPVKWTDPSNQQQEINKPDVVAPGVNICAAQWEVWYDDRHCQDQNHIAISGTSMATPHVAGVVALLSQAVPNATPADIKEALKNSAVPFAGFDENTQGKGLVNTIEALKLLSPNLDFSQKISSDPFSWRVTGNINSSTFSTSQTFTIKNNTTTATTADLSTPDLPSGISISLNRSSISIPAGGTASFSATLTGNNNTLISGKNYFAKLSIISSIKNLSVSVIVNIPNRISTDKYVDFGMDNPDFQGTWTVTKPINIKNLQSVSGVYNASVSCCYGPGGAISSGIGVSLSTNSISLAGNEQKTINATVNVNNSILSNGIYSGFINVSSPNQLEIKIPFVVTKFYRLKVTFPEGQIPDNVSWHDQGENYAVTNPLSTEQVFYLPEKYSKLDITAVFNISKAKGEPIVFVTKENIAFNGDMTISLDPVTATIEYRTIYRGIYGEEMDRMDLQYPALKNKKNGLPPISIALSNYEPRTYRFNPTSNSYTFSVSAVSKYNPNSATEVRKAVNWEYADIDGINSNRVFENSKDDLKWVPIYGNSPTGEDRLIYSLDSCLTTVRAIDCNSMFSENAEMLKVNKYRFDMFMYSGGNLSENALAIVYQKPRLTNAAQTMTVNDGPAILFDATQGLIRFNHGPRGNLIDPSPTLLPSVSKNRIDMALAPPRYGAKWQISPGYKNIAIILPNGLVNSQEWGNMWQPQFNYKITRNGQSIQDGLVGGADPVDFEDIGNTPGQIDAEIYGNIKINDVDTKHSFKGTFNIPQGYNSYNLDLQPPTTKSVDFLSGDIPSQVVDFGRVNTFKFVLDPQAVSGGTDSITSATVRIKTDTSDWQNLAVSKNNTTGEYSVTIPLVSGANLYTIEMKAVDNYNNTLTYTSELPKGFVPTAFEPPKEDTIAPSVSISSPESGSYVANTIIVKGNASDNVKVTKVELLVDGVVKGTDTSSPYEISWDTKTVVNGSRNISLKAYDIGGNVASASRSVIVANDSNLPVISIVDPQNGRIVSDNVSIITLATDDIKIVKIELYVDGILQPILFGEAGSPNYFAFSLDSKSLVNAAHTLQAKAYDPSGNIGVSAIITVTSNNIDTDEDKFPDFLEDYLGTNKTRKCPQTPVKNDEVVDSWPTDMNDDKYTTLADVVTIGDSINKHEGQSGYKVRYDLNKDRVINSFDLNVIKLFYNTKCL